MRKLILLIILILYTCLISGQNIVLNGNFEEFTMCPKELGAQEKPKVLKNVTNPNQGSFDFIHTCDDSNYPRYYWGEETPQSGEGYTGISVFINSSNYDGGEYLQLQLKDSLTRGKIYHFEMYLSLADKTHIAINKLGVYFSNTFVQQNNPNTCRFKPDIISPNFYENKVGWEKYAGEYIALGGEKYLIIGNFYSFKNTNIKILDSKAQINDNYVYYFIDNVSLTVNNNLALGIVLNNINFKSGKSELLIDSFDELNKLISVLEINPNYNIEIIGHTDNEGNDLDNLILSKNRAKTVADFLIQKGIKKERITFFGLGCKKPINENDSNEGRAKNRRVEFLFKK